MENNKVYAMKFSKVYPLLVQKAERKDRTKQEVDEIICWLTGYDEKGLMQQLQDEVDYKTFFDKPLVLIRTVKKSKERYAASALKTLKIRL